MLLIIQYKLCAPQKHRISPPVTFSFPSENAAVLHGLPAYSSRLETGQKWGKNMSKEIVTSAYSEAYRAWFSDYERERRRQKKRTGARLDDFPAPPTAPDEIAQAVDRIGTRQALQALGVHRSTLARWLAGRSVIPRPAWLLLVLLADGRLPGMSEDWRDFRFIGDRLYLVGTACSWSAREIAGWPYQMAHAEALALRIRQLEKEKAHLLKVGRFDAANDPLVASG
jgi:hypothetical protein